MTAALGLNTPGLKNKIINIPERWPGFEELDRLVKAFRPALDLLEYSHKLKKFLLVESDASYIPSINDFSDFLFRKDTALMIALSEKQDWKLRSGLAGTYNSTPVPGKEEMDLKYYIRMIYEFD